MTTTRPGYIWSGTEWVAIGQEAVVAPVSYQATEPTSPATGDIWIDSDDEVPGITSSLNYRWRKIATGGETSLSGNDTSGLPLAYNPGYEQVYLNGVLLYRGSDYVATTGNTITGLTALVANDTVEVLSFVTAPIGDTYTQAAADAKFATKVNFPSGWINFTPTFTNLTVGNGTLNFTYSQLGKTINVRGYLTFGSTTSITGTVSFTLPMNTATTVGGPILGSARLNDSGTATYIGFVSVASGSTAVVTTANVAGTYPTMANISATVPHTWATSDSLLVNFTYQAV
jgi:hypothetical protein